MGSFLVIAALFVLGAVVTLASIGFMGHGDGAPGEGDIEIVFNRLGKIVGLNGRALVFVAGAIMVLAAIFYSSKVYDKAHYEVMQDRARGQKPDGKKPDNLLWAFIKHFNPRTGF